MIRPELQEFMEACELALKKHDAAKGESWRTCDIVYLYDKLMDEIEEFKEDLNTNKELIDIANICMMLWHRLKEE